MDWQLTPFVCVLGFATLVSLCVAAIGLWHRDRPGGLTLGLMMLAVASWCCFYILEAGATTVAGKVLWSQAAYIGTLTAPPLFLQLVLTVTQQGRRWRGLLPWLVWSIPAMTLPLVFTNSAHGLIWSGFSFGDSTRSILTYARGPWFWVMVTHIYALLALSTTLLVGATLRYRPTRTRSLYRQQILFTLFSLAPPWILNGLYVLQPDLLKGLDWTPAGFALTGVFLLWNIAKLQFIDLVPVARDRVVASLEDAVIVVDHQGRIADVNPAAERLLERSDMVGTLARSTLAHWLGTPMTPSIVATGGNGTETMLPLRDFLPPQGEVVTPSGILEWRVAPLEAGISPGHVILLHDVTARKQAEVALQSMNSTLEFRVAERTAEILAQKERSDAILRSVSDGILMTDRDLYILYVNPTFTELSGYGAEEALGCPAGEILGAEVGACLERAQLHGQPCQEELQLTHKDGRVLDVAVTLSPVNGHSGITGYVCTLRDVTRSKNLERARKSFIDNISHELRTPVTNLRLYAHLMQMGELSEQNRSYLRVMENQTAWLQHLIEDILEMTSLDSGEAVHAWTTLSAGTMMEDLTARFQPQAERAGLTLRVQGPSPTAPVQELPVVRGDHVRLIQAMSEIIDNAIRFTPAGGEVLLELALTASDNERRWVTLSITDTGPGIPQEEQPRVFDRFFRGALTETGHLPGTGLGLSIAEAIIRAHGGHITLKTGAEGSTFTVWLPAAPVDVAATEMREPVLG